MRRIALVACLTATLALPATAQDTREARLAAAQAHVALVMEDLDLPAMIRTMYQPLVDQVQAGGRQLSEAQLAEIDALYQRTMAEPLRGIMAAQDQIMADLFTLEEIEALAAFYASPVGRQVMTKLPEMVALQQPQIIALVQREVPSLIPELQRIIGP